MPAAGGPGRAGPGSRGRAGPGGLGRGWGWGSGWGWGVWGEPWGLAGAGGAVTTGRYNKESPSLPGTSQGGAFASQKRKKQDTPHPTPDTRTHPGEPSESREGPALLQKLSRDVDPEQNRGAQDRARGLRGGRRTPRGCSARPLPRLRFRGAQERTLSSPCAHARRRLLASFRLGVWGGRSRVASRGFRGAGHSRFWVTGRPWDPPNIHTRGIHRVLARGSEKKGDLLASEDRLHPRSARGRRAPQGVQIGGAWGPHGGGGSDRGVAPRAAAQQTGTDAPRGGRKDSGARKALGVPSGAPGSPPPGSQGPPGREGSRLRSRPGASRRPPSPGSRAGTPLARLPGRRPSSAILRTALRTAARPAAAPAPLAAASPPAAHPHPPRLFRARPVNNTRTCRRAPVAIGIPGILRRPGAGRGGGRVLTRLEREGTAIPLRVERAGAQGPVSPGAGEGAGQGGGIFDLWSERVQLGT